MPAIFPPGTSTLAQLRSLAARGDLFAEGIMAIMNNTYWASISAGTEAGDIIRLTGQVKDQDGNSIAAAKSVLLRSRPPLKASLSDVTAATAAALATVTASGTGVGKTLTATANAALVVDGVTVANGQRILVKNQVAGADNGIYTVTSAGSGGSAFVLTRATDFDTAGEALQALQVRCVGGTVNAGTTFVHTTLGTITMETTALTFANLTTIGTMALGAAGATVNGGSGTREVWLTTSATGGFSIDLSSVLVGGHLVEIITDNGQTELDVITFA